VLGPAFRRAQEVRAVVHELPPAVPRNVRGWTIRVQASNPRNHGSLSRGNSHSHWLRDPKPARIDLMRSDSFARRNGFASVMCCRSLSNPAARAFASRLSDSAGSLCERCSQELHNIRFSGASLHQADMAVGRSNRKARRDGQWCAVLTRQPASVTVTSQTPLRGVLERGDESGDLSRPIRKGEVARTREGDWQSLAVP
jgi:hypothetical protein